MRRSSPGRTLEIERLDGEALVLHRLHWFDRRRLSLPVEGRLSPERRGARTGREERGGEGGAPQGHHAGDRAASLQAVQERSDRGHREVMTGDREPGSTQALRRNERAADRALRRERGLNRKAVRDGR